MTAGQLIALDLFAGLLAAVAWLGAATAAAAGRPRVALPLLAAAVLATLGRGASVAALWSGGWWFVQEKIAVALPLLAAAGLAAVLLAGPGLVRAMWPGGPGRLPASEDQRPGMPESGGAGEAGVRAAGVVALFTAGYAGMAGLALTFLGGYPATWGSALVTVALVGAGTLVTWRVLVPGRSGARPWLGAAALAMGLAGAGLTFTPAEAADNGGGTAHHEGHEGHGTPVSALRGPSTPAPGGKVRRYALTARTATITLASGRRVEAWTFDGRSPGPEITATEGDVVEVTLRNADIETGVTLHWHGYDVPAAEDGAPGLTQDTVMPGQEYVYRFRADQVGTYWYHTHQVSHQGVRMGLYGTLVVTPRAKAAAGLDLTLPVHTFGATMVLGDDDRPVGRQARPGTPVRLRLINTDSTPHRFTLTGTPYRLAAVDGRDLHGPGELRRVALVLAAGGRYDLAFTMPAGPVALLVDNARSGGLRLTSGGPAGAVEDTAGWPELDLTRYGTPANAPISLDSRFDRRFTLVLDRGLAMVDGVPKYAEIVNGLGFPSIPTQVVRQNDLVLFTIVNRSLEVHPWHLHGHAVLVLSRNGRRPTGSPVWHDTFDVLPGEVWQVAFRATNPGLWMNHCHNLAHAEQGMALHLAYNGVTTPFHGGHGG
jgi:FtsP/CotA-like multicopper oxidase with cupredoxin domain